MRFGEIDRFLVALEDAAAVQYFTHALYVPQGIRGRIRRAIGRPRLRRVPEATGIETLRALMDEFPNALNGVRGGIYLRDYASSDRGRVVAFFFRDQDATPFAIAKAQHARRGAASLEFEAQALEQMRAFLPPALKPTLPRLLAFRSSTHGELLATSALPGRSGYIDLQGSLAPWRNVDAHFDAAARWLAAFHDATRSSVASQVAGRTIFHSACHGDFWVRNILLGENGGPGVVDWEHFVPAASPFVDLFHYPLTYGISYPWRRYHRVPEQEAFRRTFRETNRVASAVKRYLRTYAERMQIEDEVVHAAFDQFLGSEGRMHDGVPPRPGTAGLPWASFREIWLARA